MRWTIWSKSTNNPAIFLEIFFELADFEFLQSQVSVDEDLRTEWEKRKIRDVHTTVKEYLPDVAEKIMISVHDEIFHHEDMKFLCTPIQHYDSYEDCEDCSIFLLMIVEYINYNVEVSLMNDLYEVYNEAGFVLER